MPVPSARARSNREWPRAVTRKDRRRKSRRSSRGRGSRPRLRTSPRSPDGSAACRGRNRRSGSGRSRSPGRTQPGRRPEDSGRAPSRSVRRPSRRSNSTSPLLRDDVASQFGLRSTPALAHPGFMRGPPPRPIPVVAEPAPTKEPVMRVLRSTALLLALTLAAAAPALAAPPRGAAPTARPASALASLRGFLASL